MSTFCDSIKATEGDFIPHSGSTLVFRMLKTASKDFYTCIIKSKTNIDCEWRMRVPRGVLEIATQSKEDQPSCRDAIGNSKSRYKDDMEYK
ncbi:hypothetical protein NQ315_002537 [Exocentrus adspersus]|uniref:Uncharacterized protein n=1 Tax=Exocentrus adspersus TaxID=1586481 RepID=A0AAV8VF65_9CUCU|nr:hypothetical protein NQ315_002537 [Exocentrus adspersus]